MENLIAIARMNGRYVMPEVGAYDIPSFCLAAMEQVAVDMAFAVDMIAEE